MWKGEKSGAAWEEYLASIDSPSGLAGELGFIPGDTPEENREEYSRRIDSESGPGEVLLSFINNDPHEGGTPTQSIRLGVRIPASGNSDELAEDDIFRFEGSFPNVLPSEEEGIAIDKLRNGGYGKIFQFLDDQFAVFKQNQEKDGSQTTTSAENDEDDKKIANFFSGLQEHLESLYAQKLAQETEQHPELLEEIIRKFQEIYSEYNNRIQVKKDTYLCAEGELAAQTPCIKIQDTGIGFKVHIGAIAMETGKKGEVKVKGRGNFFTVSPIAKSAIDWAPAYWKDQDADEAVHYAELYKNGLNIYNRMLQQPATWSDELQRSLTLEEVLAYQKSVTGDYLELPLPESPPVESVERSYALTDRQLLSLTIERLRYLQKTEEEMQLLTGVTIPIERALQEVATGTSLGRQIMRLQIVQLESQISMIQIGKYTAKDPDKT